MITNYKILCEVKLLHEFYLTDKDGSTIFDLPAQQDKIDFLTKRFEFDYPSINNDLSYEPSENQKQVFENNKIRVIQSYSGFKVFVSVKEKMLAGNIKAYQHALNVADDLSIFILLKKRNNFLDSFSNSSIARAVHARYYFTNRNLGETKVPPVLSTFPPLRDDTIRYEQGQLVVDPSDNATKAFFHEKDGSLNWLTVPASDYINTNDFSLVPANPLYYFSKADAITDVTFILKDSNGATVSTITSNSPSPMSNVSLNYSAVATTLLGDDVTTLPPQPFSLEVNGTNGFHKKHSLVFASTDLLDTDTWGVVHLIPKVADAPYNLFDNDGLLITRKNPDGSVVSHPIFEIRIKSRFAFWRYFNNKNLKIKDNAALHPFLDYDATEGIMEMKKMLNASFTPIEFTNLGATQYLPNPDNDAPLSMDLLRVYADVRVPESDLFKKL